MHTATLCLGSNVSPRRLRIADAIERLGRLGRIIEVSEALESDDVTGRSGPYFNQAVKCATALGRDEFARAIAEAEAAGGRRPDRSLRGIIDIDIDLIIWDGEIVAQADYDSPYFARLR